MSSPGGGGNLTQAVKDLSNAWQQTKTFWHDSKSQEFERTYIEILPAQVTQTLMVMEELDNLLKKIRSECE